VLHLYLVIWEIPVKLELKLAVMAVGPDFRLMAVFVIYVESALFEWLVPVVGVVVDVVLGVLRMEIVPGIFR
jgi:hypothetical protein